MIKPTDTAVLTLKQHTLPQTVGEMDDLMHDLSVKYSKKELKIDWEIYFEEGDLDMPDYAVTFYYEK